jgi:hypothetical protein
LYRFWMPFIASGRTIAGFFIRACMTAHLQAGRQVILRSITPAGCGSSLP